MNEHDATPLSACLPTDQNDATRFRYLQRSWTKNSIRQYPIVPTSKNLFSFEICGHFLDFKQPILLKSENHRVLEILIAIHLMTESCKDIC